MVIKGKLRAPLYGKRPAGSFSKLNTFSDGFRVLFEIVPDAASPTNRSRSSAVSASGFSVLGLLVGRAARQPVLCRGPGLQCGERHRGIGLVILSFLSTGYLELILNSINLRLLEIEKLIWKASGKAAAVVAGWLVGSAK